MFKSVPKPLNKTLQKLPLNLESLFDTIAFGIPCNMAIYFIDMFEILVAVRVVFIGIK